MKGTTTNVASLFNSSQNRQFYIEKKIGNAFVYLVHVRLWTYKNGDRKTFSTSAFKMLFLLNIGSTFQEIVYSQFWMICRMITHLTIHLDDLISFELRLYLYCDFCLIENIKSIVYIDLNIRKICRYKNWLEVTSPWNDDYKC